MPSEFVPATQLSKGRPTLVERDPATTAGEQPEPKKKKPYSTPKLIVYGKLSDLVKSVGNAGVADGGITVGHQKTH